MNAKGTDLKTCLTPISTVVCPETFSTPPLSCQLSLLSPQKR